MWKIIDKLDSIIINTILAWIFGDWKSVLFCDGKINYRCKTTFPLFDKNFSHFFIKVGNNSGVFLLSGDELNIIPEKEFHRTLFISKPGIISCDSFFEQDEYTIITTSINEEFEFCDTKYENVMWFKNKYNECVL